MKTEYPLENYISYLAYPDKAAGRAVIIAPPDQYGRYEMKRLPSETLSYVKPNDDGTWLEVPATIKGSNGFEWTYHGNESDDHLAFGGHEPAIVAIAKSLLPDGGIFLDVGAHVGLYSVELATKASAVIAIEANPETYKVLRDNLSLNVDQFTAEIDVVNAAAWDQNEVELSLVDENGLRTGGSTRCVAPMPGDEFVTMAYRLDTLLNPDSPIHLVKIDVEGAEARVLRGMQSITENHHPRFLIEMHDEIYSLPKVRTEVLRFLESQNYTLDESMRFGSGYYIIARHESDVDEFEIEIVKAGS